MPKEPNPPLAQAFGEVLRDLRKELGLTQDKLSEMSGLSTNFISFCERGQQQPSPELFFEQMGSIENRISAILE